MLNWLLESNYMKMLEDEYAHLYFWEVKVTTQARKEYFQAEYLKIALNL